MVIPPSPFLFSEFTPHPPYPHWCRMHCGSEEEDKQDSVSVHFPEEIHNHFLKCLLCSYFFPADLPTGPIFEQLSQNMSHILQLLT